MTKCIATIQEGHKAEGLQEELATELKRIAALSFERSSQRPTPASFSR